VNTHPLFVGIAAFAMLVPVVPVEAQSVLQRARERAAERIEQRTNESVNKAINRAENAISCVVTDTACVESARSKGQDVVMTDREGNTLPPEQQPPPQRVGQGAWANYDFVPGERVLFYEDFSRDRVGNFPRRFEFLTGAAEIVEWQGRRWLRTNDRTAFRVPLPETLPERFTIEFDAPIPWCCIRIHSEPVDDGSGAVATSSFLLSGTEVGAYRNSGSSGTSTVDPRPLFGGDDMYADDAFLSRLMRISIQVDGGYMKMYVDERRVANMPNGAFGRQNYIVFEFDDYGREDQWPLITAISINAGGTPMYDALMAEGRFATQGILFATGSDRIRPESTPTLKEIGEMLKTYPDLRLAIEGHTDNVGQTAANQTLSEQRAAAVREYLVSSHGIDASRLEARGFGASKPAASNDTPEGRQGNRRVELVRL
jgi:OmpA-OmpF porin, OOP family